MAGVSWRDAGMRLCGHYQRCLERADRCLHQGGVAPWERSRVELQADWDQIVQAQAWAAEATAPAGPPDPDRARRCIDYVIGTEAVLGAIAPAGLQWVWTESALAAARQLGLAEEQRYLLYRSALLARNLERIDEVERRAGELLGLADAAGDALAAGRAWLLLGRAQALGERFELARISYEACERLLSPFGPSADLLDCWGGMGAVAYFEGRHAEAYAIGQRQLAGATRLGEWLPIGAAHLTLSGVANHLPGHEGPSLAHADAALDAGRRSASLRLIAHAQVLRGHALRRQDRYDEAAEAYCAALGLPASTLSPSSQVNAIHGQGQLAVARGDRAAARVLFERALAMAAAHPAVQGSRLCETCHELVHLHLADGRLAEAKALLPVYARAAERLGYPPQQLGLMLALGWVCLACDRPARLRELLELLRAERGRLHADAARELQRLADSAQISLGPTPVLPDRPGPVALPTRQAAVSAALAELAQEPVAAR